MQQESDNKEVAMEFEVPVLRVFVSVGRWLSHAGDLEHGGSPCFRL